MKMKTLKKKKKLVLDNIRKGVQLKYRLDYFLKNESLLKFYILIWLIIVKRN